MGMIKSREMDDGARIGNGGREKRVSYKVLVGKPEGKNLGRRKGRWEDNSKMLLQDGQLWTEQT